MTPQTSDEHAPLRNYIENMILNIADELNVKEVVIDKDGVYGTYRYNTLTGDAIGFSGNEWMLGSTVFTGSVIDDMEFVRDVVREGLRKRSDLGVKVRQPLQRVTIKARF